MLFMAMKLGMDIHSTCHGVGGYGPPLYTVFLGMALHSTQAQFLTLWEISTVWGSMVRAASKDPGGRTEVKNESEHAPRSGVLHRMGDSLTIWEVSLCISWHEAWYGHPLNMPWCRWVWKSTLHCVSGYGPPLNTVFLGMDFHSTLI